MSGLGARYQALAVLSACGSVAYVTPPPVAVAALLLGVLATVLGPRLELDRVGQAGLTIGAMVLGVLVPRLAHVPESSTSDTLLSDRTMLLVLPMLGVAAARSLVAKPMYGVRLTLAAVLVALTGSGRAQTGWVYPAFFVCALVFGLLALREGDPERAPLSAMRRPHIAAVALVVTLTASITVGMALVLPSLHEAMLARIMERFERNRLGFSDNMVLGAMSGLLVSDEVVMRVRGPAPALLRGVVLVRYAAGRWERYAELPPPEVVETRATPEQSPSLVEIEHSGVPKRYFLPLGAKDVSVSSGIYERDVFRIAKPATGFPAKRVWFENSSHPDATASFEPHLEDLRFPRRLAATLGGTLATWGVREEQPPRERAERIMAELNRSYRYSLDFPRDPAIDPIEDFLTQHPEGHCEYFASSMTLLLRAARVPARVIAGYRVVEQSPLGYHVIRERNAHSWVEAWIDEQWVTFDPTPASDLALVSPERTSWPGALLDGLATSWEAFDDWLARRTPFELSLILVGLIGVLIMARTLRAARQRSKVAVVLSDRPLPGFARLLDALAAHGVKKPPAETLEVFEERVRKAEALSPTIREGVAGALSQYASLRYGGIGKAAQVEARLAELHGQLRR